MIRTFLTLTATAAVWCAPGSGATPPVAPDPSPLAGARVATVSQAPYAYLKKGFVVIVGRPTGYGPSGVVYRFWNPWHGG